MLSEIFVAVFLFGCLICFFSVNLHNILVVSKRRDKNSAYAEVGSPSVFFVSLASLGTLVYFSEALTFIVSTFVGLISLSHISILNIQIPFADYTQILVLY